MGTEGCGTRQRSKVTEEKLSRMMAREGKKPAKQDLENTFWRGLYTRLMADRPLYTLENNLVRVTRSYSCHTYLIASLRQVYSAWYCEDWMVPDFGVKKASLRTEFTFMEYWKSGRTSNQLLKTSAPTPLSTCILQDVIRTLLIMILSRKRSRR